MTTVERVLALRATSLFASSPPEVVLDVAERTDDVVLEPLQVLFRAGDLGDHMYVVVDGEVAIRAGDVELVRLGPGGAFGELALLDPVPRSADARAVGPTRLLSLSREVLTDLLADRPEVTDGIMRAVAARLRALTVSRP